MSGRWKSLLLGAAALGLLAVPAGSAPAPVASGPHGEILWDTFGVPHVFGKDEAGVFYGFGWAQVKSHANLVLRLYGQAQGRAAEYWGQDYAESDRWVVSNGIYDRAKQWYGQQTPQFRKDLDAFAAGMTDSARKNAANIDPEVLKVLPLTGVDVIAHAHRLFNYIYVTSLQQLQNIKDEHDVGGSNAWAVAPAKSKSGNTMLLANPHLPWAPSYFTYYEAGLEGPGIHMYGATQIGLPMLRFDFDDRHGFTNTVNTILGATIYKLTPAEGGFQNGYMFDGKVMPFTTRQASFKIRQSDGSMKTEDLTIRSTVQGPVFTTKAGATVALRVAGLERPEALKEYWDLGMAKTYDQALAAFKKVQVPTFNIVYADREGNILYVDNGIEPKRKQGDFAYWKGLVPGDTSETLWQDSDVMTFDEIPHVANPPSGFVQNTNDPPWTSTMPQAIHYKDYPPYIAVEGPLSMRNEQSLHLMADSGKISYDDFIRLKHTTRALLADRMVPELINMVGTSSDPDIQKAVAVLKGWDHQYNADSRGRAVVRDLGEGICRAQHVERTEFRREVARGQSDRDPARHQGSRRGDVDAQGGGGRDDQDLWRGGPAVWRGFAFPYRRREPSGQWRHGQSGHLPHDNLGPDEGRPAHPPGGRNLGLDGGVLQAGQGDGRDGLRRFQPAGIEAQQRPAEIRRGAEVAHLMGQAPDVLKHVEEKTEY